jgi:penicillin G amidase
MPPRSALNSRLSTNAMKKPLLATILLGLAMINWPLASVCTGAETAEELRSRARQVLAQLDGDIRAPQLKQPVEVVRDRWGIPHIYAQNQDDLFFAQGFVTAQDRLFQLDLWRRIGLGQTAELFGGEAIEADRFARLMLYRGDMEAEWRSYADDTKSIATAFVGGINAYIDHVADKLPIEFQILGTRPQKWRPEDILSRMSGIIMTSNWQREVTRARLIATAGEEYARAIAPTDPTRGFAMAPGVDAASITMDILNGYAAATRPLKFPPIQTESNNWVIDGALSTSGRPLLANDPHRAIALPSLRYLVHLHAPGWNVIGSGEPALPGVAIGHNERIAWGFTIVGTDQADLYVEETRPDDPRQYKVGDRWEPMRIVREDLRVRGRAEPVPIELRFTRHGAVIHQDESKRQAVALKWVGSEPGGAAYLGSLSVARAQNRVAFVKSLAAWKSPCENFVYADVEGNIGWVAAALTPIRNGWDGLLPVPGASGRYEWQGYLDVKDLPQSFNPPNHWLATANHNILPPNYNNAIAYEWAGPQRFLRIQERLSEGRKFTVEDFQSIQHDSLSLPARSLIGVAKSAALPTELAPYAALLAKWDGTLSREAQAGPLYAVWLQELLAAFYADRVPKDARGERGDLRSVTVLLQQLSEPESIVFGPNPTAKRDELVRTTLATAVERTKKLLGDDPAGWTWGKLHTARLEHPLASLGPAYAEAFNPPAVARSGDANTPNNTRHDDNFRQMHGASYRQVFDLADWDRGVATSVPGQSGQPGSPHYDDLLPLWAEGTYFPLAFSRPKVQEVAQHRLWLRP